MRYRELVPKALMQYAGIILKNSQLVKVHLMVRKVFFLGILWLGLGLGLGFSQLESFIDGLRSQLLFWSFCILSSCTFQICCLWSSDLIVVQIFDIVIDMLTFNVLPIFSRFIVIHTYLWIWKNSKVNH